MKANSWIRRLFQEPSGQPSLPGVLLALLSIWIMGAWTVACWEKHGMAEIPNGAIEILAIASGLKFGVRVGSEAAQAYQNKPPAPNPFPPQVNQQINKT